MGLLMKREDPSTNLSAVTTTGAGSWVVCADAHDVLCVLDAASVTSGGTVVLQGNTKSDGLGSTYTISSITVSATGLSTVAITDGDVPAALRWNVTARTDGTYTGTIARRR